MDQPVYASAAMTAENLLPSVEIVVKGIPLMKGQQAMVTLQPEQPPPCAAYALRKYSVINKLFYVLLSQIRMSRPHGASWIVNS